ncbi:beta-propeller fold lactonase family protein [Ensifer sp. IC3342]|nr:beta-propeller fold lactonase family protein [Ensifer sp. BRP08]MCA1451275.1 beta-propeller fold lactonase family protein [Ensifer sp. IC3342]
MRSTSSFSVKATSCLRGSRFALLLGSAGLALSLAVSASEAATKQIAQAGVVFTADELGNTVSRVDLSSGAVTTVPVAVSPHNVQITADGRTLLVVGTESEEAAHGHGDAQGTLLVFDAVRFGSASPVEVAVGEHPAHVVADPAGKYALVTNSEDNNVSVIDLAAGKPQAVIPTGSFPHGLRISPDGKEAYVANVQDGTVSVLDLEESNEAVRIPVGKAPVQVGFSPDGAEVYVSLRDENKVAVIDTKSRKVVDRIGVRTGPIQVHATPDKRLVLVANQGTEAMPGDTVSVIDTKTRAVVKTIRTGSGAHGVAVDDQGRLAFVSNIYGDSLSIIDLSTLEVLATVPVGDGPNGVTYLK